MARNINPIVLEGLRAILSINPDDIDGSESFITLGGDSLAAIKLARFCAERQLHISVRDFFQSKRIDEILRTEAKDKSHGLNPMNNDNLSTHETSTTSRLASSIRRVQTGAHDAPQIQESALTGMQLSFIHENGQYTGQNIIRFCETYSCDVLPTVRRAWEHVINQEAIFRPPTVNTGRAFASNNWTDIQVESESEYEAELAKAKRGETSLSCFKAIILRRRDHVDSICTVVWCVHHAFIDGYSAHLLHRKMLDMANGHSVIPGPSFWTVASQLKDLQKSTQTPRKEFWTTQYARFSAAASKIIFPSRSVLDVPRIGDPMLRLQFPSDRIAECSTAIDVTPAAFYCAAWGLTLSKFLNNDQVSFGMVFSGRDLPVANIQTTIGPCINTLPFFVSTENPATLDTSTYIRSIFQDLCEYSAFQLVSPEDAVTRDYSSVVAFQYSMNSTLYDSTYNIVPIGGSSFSMDSGIPISVIIQEDGVIELRFNHEVYTTKDMRILGDLFQNAMESILQLQDSVLQALDQTISAAAKAEICQASNCNAPSSFSHSHGKAEDVVMMFEEMAKCHPQSLAVVQGPLSMTYGDLNHAASSVAEDISHYIQPGDAVCVIADRSMHWLAAIFGILKARGVYVPLDPNVPSVVRNENFDRCAGKLFIATTRETLSACPSGVSQYLVVENILRGISRAYPSRTKPLLNDVAYICFTSGSTGRPKAVQCTQKGLVSFLGTKEVRLFAENGVRIAQTMSPVFDGSIAEIFSALCYGATLHLPETGTEHPFAHLQECDVALFTPSVGKVLNPNDFPNLKHVSHGTPNFGEFL